MQLTIRVTKLSKGYMADLKEFPEILVWNNSEKGLITKLLKSISGYEEAFPNRIENILTKNDKREDK